MRDAMAADIAEKMERTRKAGKRIAIDGCDAKKVVDKVKALVAAG